MQTLSRRRFHGLVLGQATAMIAGSAIAAPIDSSLSRHDFLATGEYDHRKPDQTLFVVRGGKVVWTYSIPLYTPAKVMQELGDAAMLPNGNVLFSRKTGAMEVSPAKKIVWNMDAPEGSEIHSVQPLGLDRVLVVQNGNPGKLLTINKRNGRIEREIHLPVPNGLKPHIQFRRVERTAKGTYLAGHLDGGKVVEYDADGVPIWTYAVDRPYAVVRLDNGNTLISSYNAAKQTEVIEVNGAAEVVWRFSQADVPDIPCFQFQGVQRLANGNTVICNWCVGALKDPAAGPTATQVLEVRPDKTIAWALRQWTNPDLGPISSIQFLPKA